MEQDNKFTWKPGDVKILSKEEYEAELKKDKENPNVTIRKIQNA